MRWYSNYLQILKSASTIAEENAGEIYRLAFDALKKYGVATLNEGVWTIEDDGLIYSIQEEFVNSDKEKVEDILPTNQPNDGISSIDFEAIKERLEEPKEAPLFEMETETNDFEDDSVEENTQESSLPSAINEEKEGNHFSLNEASAPEEYNPFENNFVEADEGNPFALPGGDLTDEILEDIPSENPFYDEVNVKLNQIEIPEESIETPEIPTPSENSLDVLSNDLLTQNSSEEPSSEEPYSNEVVNSNMSLNELPPQQFPLFLQSKDFTFAISGVNSKDLSQQATFLIAPLRTDIETPASVVKAVINGNEFIYTTDSNGKIEFETEVYTYAIESIMKDGKFAPNVYVKNEDMSNFNHTQKTFGDKGHIALVDEEDDITVHIFPTSFKANEYHTADFIYCIDTGDGDFFSDTNRKEKSAFVKINGDTFEITAKWKDGVLYAKIEQA